MRLRTWILLDRDPQAHTKHRYKRHFIQLNTRSGHFFLKGSEARSATCARESYLGAKFHAGGVHVR